MSTTKVLLAVGAVALVGGAIYLATRPTAPASGSSSPTTSGSSWWSQIITGTVALGSSLVHELGSKKTGGSYVPQTSTTGGGSTSGTVLA